MSTESGTRDEAEELRNRLVEELVSQGVITSEPVRQAFTEVPRHMFVPRVDIATAYSDQPIFIRWDAGVPISSSTQPKMMALMMEQLGVEPGSRVMEIGAGTGYNAAIPAHVAGEKGSVITMDIDQDIVDEAAGNLSETGYGHVKAVCGDGFEGFPEGGPYDRIMATVGAYDVSPHWVDQLKEGGVSRSGWYPAPGTATATASCARSDRATHTGLQYRSAAGSGSASGKQDANQHQSSKGTLGSPWVHDFTTTV